MRQESNNISSTKSAVRIHNFILISIGQIISMLGTGLTNFAISLWVLQRTGSITQFSLLLLIITLPGLFVTPIAGAVADRMNRRLVMIFSDAGGVISTLIIVLLFHFDYPSIWFIACALAVSSISSCFRSPAYLASVSLLVPKEQLGRANGVIQIGEGLGKILAPAIAGVLLMKIGVQGVILIDSITFVIAICMLLVSTIPDNTGDIKTVEEKPSLYQQATAGWLFIRSKPALLALLVLFVILSFIMGMAEVLVPPMLIASASPAIVGTVVSIFGSGLLVGSIAMSIWPGPKRRIYGVFLFAIVHSLGLVLAGLRSDVAFIAAGLFLWTFSMPFINGSMRVIYQLKTPVKMQGRVFATASLFVQIAMPIAFIISGPLADHLFEPLFGSRGALADSIGVLIGTGKGRGIAFMLILMGIAVMVSALAGYLYPRLRQIESELPDAIEESDNESLQKLSVST